MTIKELEALTGLSRANIRFYEKEGLLSPLRRENGYREYTEEDVQTLLRQVSDIVYEKNGIRLEPEVRIW